MWVEHLLTSLPGGQIGFLVFVNVLVFLLAFFLDFFEIAFIIIPLLGPAAEKLGIDLIWFGVMLGVNMQTTFMHPPFGFALFYLRSVAPREPFIDKVTGKMDPVTTGQIYWGAVPFVVIQVIMVGLVIAFPSMVMHYKGAASTIDPSKIKIEIPQIETAAAGLRPAEKLISRKHGRRQSGSRRALKTIPALCEPCRFRTCKRLIAWFPWDCGEVWVQTKQGS